MIESSLFCMLSGVGLNTERRLWQRGVGAWMEFLCAGTIPGKRLREHTSVRIGAFSKVRDPSHQP